MTHSQLVDEVMNLPDKDRAELALALIRSLGQAPGGELARDEADWHRAWGVELERRMADVRSGKAKTIPAADVFRR